MEEILLKASLWVVFGIVSAIAVKAIGLVLTSPKEIKKKVDSLEKALIALKETLPKEYVLKDDHDRDIQEIKTEIRELKEEIREGFRRIEEKLDQKADKK